MEVVVKPALLHPLHDLLAKRWSVQVGKYFPVFTPIAACIVAAFIAYPIASELDFFSVVYGSYSLPYWVGAIPAALMAGLLGRTTHDVVGYVTELIKLWNLAKPEVKAAVNNEDS